MPIIVSVIFEIVADIVSTTMGLMFYLFLFRLIFQRKPKAPKEIRGNEHAYYPFRFYVPFLKLICVYIALMIIMISLKLWIRGDWEGGRDIAVVCAGYTSVALYLPFEKKVNRVVINTAGITFECYKGTRFHYTPDQYDGCEGKYLYFKEQSGARKREKLHFLCLEDRESVIQDTELLKKTGKLTVETVVTAQEAWRKATQQFQEEKQKLYADTGRYEAYLKEEASKRLTASQKQDLVRMIRLGDKMNAIKRCREWTGLGLKEAKDMVEQYRKCLVEKEEDDNVIKTQENPIRQDAFERENKSFSWKWRISGREQEFSEEKSLESTMDQLLSDLSMRREESIALIPPAPLLGIVCVRASLDPQGIMYRAEVEYVEHDAQGNPKILYKNGLMSWDVRDVFVTFRRKAKVETDGWQ